MNSAPMFQAIGTAVRNKPFAMITARTGCRMNWSSTGVYSRLIQRISQSSFSCSPVAQAERGHHGHERERQDQRAGQGEDHGQRHGPEQLSLGALEGQDRQVDDRDDQLAEHRRLPHLDRGIADDVELGPGSPLVGEPAHAVLDHDHAGIDDQAEVDRAQAHQAGRHSGGEHDVGREEHGQRNGQRDDQAAAEVAEHGQQHHDHQDTARHQVVQHRAQRLVDQVGAVIERLDRDAGGQTLLKLGDLGLDIGRPPSGRSGRSAS